MASIMGAAPGNDDFPALVSIYNAGSPAILSVPGQAPHYVPPGTAGSVPTHRPWTNEAWRDNHRREIFCNHWGFCTSPGYIDSVVAAQNEYILRKGAT